MAPTSVLFHGVPSKFLTVFFAQPFDGLFLALGLVPYLFQLPYFAFQHGLGGHAVLAFANIAEMDARLAVGVPFTGCRVWAKHGRHFLKNAEKILKSIDI